MTYQRSQTSDMSKPSKKTQKSTMPIITTYISIPVKPPTFSLWLKSLNTTKTCKKIPDTVLILTFDSCQVALKVKVDAI